MTKYLIVLYNTNRNKEICIITIKNLEGMCRDYMITEAKGLEVIGELKQGYEEILTPEALQFVERLERQFGARRKELLEKRKVIQEEINKGKLPKFLEETKHIREGDWTISPVPKDLDDRRVEITGPVDRKMVINALNSGAHLFMADFEDANHQLGEMLSKVKLTCEMRVSGTISL